MRDAAKLFCALSSAHKAEFLANVIHDATISARGAYVDNYDLPDGVRLREANEFVHRIAGYIPHVLNGTEMGGQAESLIAMIFEEMPGRLRHEQWIEWLRAMHSNDRE
jgi:hypothetical protein